MSSAFEQATERAEAASRRDDRVWANSLPDPGASPKSGNALRARLSPANRRSVLSDARSLSEGLWLALGCCDGLLETEALSDTERDGLVRAREAILVAFRQTKSKAPDLTGFVPVEAFEEHR